MAGTTNPQVFNIDFSHWNSNITISDANTNQTLFISSRSRGSTQLEVTDSSGQIIGTSKRSRMSSQVDVMMANANTNTNNISGQESVFEINGSGNLLGSDPKYRSPAFDGQEMIWKLKRSFGKFGFTLTDGSGVEVARFEGHSRRKIGTLEILVGGPGDFAARRVNEIVVTLLTLLVKRLKNVQTAQISAAAGAS